MQGVLTELQRDLGITFVYVTHSKSEAFAMADRIVIMSQGKIEQYGTPLEIYHHPATRFVADFIGTNNLLDGTVSAVSNDQIICNTSIGQITVPASAGPGALNQGQEISLVVGMDVVEIYNTKPDDRISWSYTYKSEEFAGTVATMYFEDSTGHEFFVQKQLREIEQLNLSVGNTVFLSWPNESVRIVTS